MIPDRQVPVTVLIATRNEAANMEACLTSLRPAKRVVVIDSHSTDDTCAIAERHGAEVVQFDYRAGLPKKRQWALDNCSFDTEWVLLIDADERVPTLLWNEIAQAVAGASGNNAFFMRKAFHFLGQRFRFGGFSFDAVLLIRRGYARFEKLSHDPQDTLDMEVHERVIVSGSIGRLNNALIHDDFKGLQAYIARHNAYSTWEAKLRARFFESSRWGDEGVRARLFGNTQERRRFLKLIAIRVPCEPVLWFVYHYIIRGAFLEGRRGLIASRMRANYIADIRAKVYESRIGRVAGGGNPGGERK